MGTENAGRPALTIDALRPDPDNANRSTERGSGLLEGILRRRGFARSIVIDRDNKVLAGNQVLAAAVNAGIVRLRVVETDGNEVIAVKRRDVTLDSTAGRELATADNAIALRSINLDGEVLARQAKAYDLDLEACGISEKELAKLLKAAADESDGEASQEAPTFDLAVKCESKADRTRLKKELEAKGYHCEAA